MSEPVSESSRSNSPVSGMKSITITPMSSKPSKSVATKSSSRRPTASKTSRKQKQTLERELKQIHAKEDSTSNFMLDFDPSKPRREKTRNTKKVDYSEAAPKRGGKGAYYNEKGLHIKSGSDFCDCLVASCPGCHFPCPKCRSTKCGFECRQNRKWQIEFIINEDSSMEKRVNEYATQTMKK